MKILTLIVICSMLCLASQVEASNPLSESMNHFSLKILSQVMKKQDNNVLLSPLSIYNAFALLYPGTSSLNKKQMYKLFQFPPDLQAITQFNDALEVNNSENAGLWLADSIWVNKGISLLPAYQKTIQGVFQASVTTLDFRQSYAAKAVNTWIANHTHQMILKVLPDRPLIPNQMVLVNAAYFQNQWLNTFKHSDTHLALFHQSPNKTSKVHMMQQTDNFSYMETNQLQMIKLPYRHGHFSMMIVLPKQGISTLAIANKLSLTQLNAWMHKLKTQDVDLSLPKMDLTYKANLKDTLQNMGLKDAFVPRQHGYHYLTHDNNFSLSSVIHQVHIKVDEQGTKAAATTVLLMAGDALILPQLKPIVMTVNKPFLLFLMDDATHTVLFVGNIIRP